MVLALVNDNTSIEDKHLMAVALLNMVRPQMMDTGKPGQPEFEPIAAQLTEEKPPLASFITQCSWLLFQLLESDTAWLHEHPAVWSDGEDSDIMAVKDPME